MAIQTQSISYEVKGKPYEGVLAWDDALTGPRPGIMVCHAWGGQGDFEVDKCRMLAELGYVALAVDVYGQGIRGTTTDENAKLMQPLIDDRAELQTRLQGSLAALQQDDRVDENNIAAIGFCFGGLCVLDVARAGTDIAGVVSFHGLLGRPDDLDAQPIGAKVMILHGWDDPMATPDAVLDVTRELSEAGADWQLHAYGATVHAFTNPVANDPGMGTVYSAKAEKRSLAAMQSFLEELFG
ncbi:MAG: dienelactone hydrolase family protein [Woeseiaceae bacterium]|nr:dienelactone hydrolase family protein [Woeseiaceae bacterium]